MHHQSDLKRHLYTSEEYTPVRLSSITIQLREYTPIIIRAINVIKEISAWMQNDIHIMIEFKVQSVKVAI